MTRHLSHCLLALAAWLLAACHRPAVPASLSSRVVDSAGVSVITLAQSLAVSASGEAGGSNDSAVLRFTVDSAEHPVAATVRPNGEVAILDRLSRDVLIVDSMGTVLRRLGGKGDGPGEFQLPAGIASVGGSLVVLQSHPSNTLTTFPSEGLPKASIPQIRGDWTGWMWQRPDIALEFPVQSAPEQWSRRLRALNDSSFLVYVGPAQGDTSASSLLLRYGPDLRIQDTVAVLPSGPLSLQKSSDPKAAPEQFSPVWTTRPVWAAGEGRVAWAAGGRPEVQVQSDLGQQLAIIRWPAGTRAVTEDDRDALGMHIMTATVAASPSAAANFAKTSASDRKAMLHQFMSTYELAPMTPELVGLFTTDGCLWLAGFDSGDAADGTAHEWVVINLAVPAVQPKLVTIGASGERVVAIERRTAVTVALEGDGTRQVRVYRVPACQAGH